MSGERPVIIGAGPAGSACAIRLAAAGVSPLIIERQRAPGDALCGGFLSWRTLDQLEQLGLPRNVLAGHEVSRLRMIHGRTSHDRRLPRPAMGLSRRRLDRLLLARARELGGELRVATARLEDGRLRLDDGQPVAHGGAFVATGKHELRGMQRPRSAAGADPMTGLRWRIAASNTLESLMGAHIELHLFDRGYAGLVLHEDGTANLCMAVRKSRLAEACGDPARLIEQLADANPLLAERVSFLDDPQRFDSIGHVPYHWRATEGREGIFRLGDQAGVIASLAGEGIGIALASAAEAVRCWREGGPGAAPVFQTRFAAQLRRPIATARIVADLAQSPAGAKIVAALSAVPGAMALIARATRI